MANFALDGIEKILVDKYPKNKKDRNLIAKYKVNFVRYADDFIVTAKNEEIAKETIITHIDTGFDFLGWNFRKYKGKLLIKPSKVSSEI